MVTTSGLTKEYHYLMEFSLEVLQENKGLLSLLVEEEVGLWTTDIGDEQITSSQVSLPCSLLML